jgi:hypothetical protein
MKSLSWRTAISGNSSIKITQISSRGSTIFNQVLTQGQDLLPDNQEQGEGNVRSGWVYSQQWGPTRSMDLFQDSFHAGVKVIFRNTDGSLEAMAIYGLEGIEYAKDTAELLALAFTPELAFRQIISYERDGNGSLVSDGSLTIYRKNIVFLLMAQQMT